MDGVQPLALDLLLLITSTRLTRSMSSFISMIEMDMKLLCLIMYGLDEFTLGLDALRCYWS